jgi:predicted RNA-binding protein with PIN domain
MRIVIDGYNLLFKIFHREPFDVLEEERQYLAELLFSYKKIKGHKIAIVFDGRKCEKFSIKGVTVIFTDSGVSADKYIMDMAGKDRGIVVVTSDNEIINYLSKLNVVAVKSEEFVSRLEEAFYQNLKGIEELEYNVDYSENGKKLKKKHRQKNRVIKKL